MLFVLFQLGDDRYALETARVAEVLPLVQVKALPQAPVGVAGVFNYRGAPVPVIDLSALALGRPAARRLSTRLILTHHTDRAGAPRLLGLLAEKATETLRCAPEEFTPAGVTSPRAPYLGPVRADARGLIQRIEPAQLLPEAVREVLFQTAAENFS